MAPSRTRPGRQLGRYRLLHELAASYLGPLWLARPEGEADATVFVRIVPLAPLEAGARVALMEAAWQAMELAGPGVTSVTDVVASEGELAVVYAHEEALPLRTLQSLSSARRKPMPVGVALRVLQDLTEAVAAIHRAADDSVTRGARSPGDSRRTASSSPRAGRRWCSTSGSPGSRRRSRSWVGTPIAPPTPRRSS
ncbi:MAG: hypothetical protein FJ104_06955 [Deltaproteobacteria bacterium]|nr:hypothetical protein [Deltaproteobacteria bacterium]